MLSLVLLQSYFLRGSLQAVSQESAQERCEVGARNKTGIYIKGRSFFQRNGIVFSIHFSIFHSKIMMNTSILLSPVSILLLIASSFRSVAAQSGTVRCTFHDYEGTFNTFGMQLDYSPPYCGMRYSVLNNARVMAVSFMEPGMCNQCIQVFGASGSSAYILAVDRKEADGLDIAGSSFQALFPGSNVLDPQTCSYQVVDHSYCAGICSGSAEECTVGVKNNLPANLLPVAGKNTNGLSAASPSARQVAQPSIEQIQSTNTQIGQSNNAAPAIVVTSSTASPSPSPSSSESSNSSTVVTGSSPQVVGSGPTAQNINRTIITSSAFKASLYWSTLLTASSTILILIL